MSLSEQCCPRGDDYRVHFFCRGIYVTSDLPVAYNPNQAGNIVHIQFVHFLYRRAVLEAPSQLVTFELQARPLWYSMSFTITLQVVENTGCGYNLILGHATCAKIMQIKASRPMLPLKLHESKGKMFKGIYDLYS